MLKVSEAFQRYRTCRQNGTIVNNMLQIFDSMTIYILDSKNVDYNFDLLQQLSLIQKDGSISQSPTEYAVAKEFRHFFKTYAEYMNVKNQNHKVVLAIVESTQSLIIEAKTSIYNFIWSLPGFRKALSKIPTIENGIEFNGTDYTRNSIFSPVLSAYKREYTSNKKSSNAFQSLTEKMTRIEFDSVFSYMMKIVRANRAYTYDNVLAYKDTLSSFELLGTVLILMVKLIQNNPEYVFISETEQIDPNIEGRITDIWDLINILYFTLFEIKKSTADSYRVNNDELMRLTNEFETTSNQRLASSMNLIRSHVDEGKSGLKRLVVIIKEISNKFVDSIIFNNISYILEHNEAGVIYRLRKYLLERGIKPNTSLSESLCHLVNSILASRTPPSLKSEYIRLIMAYDLCDEFVAIGEQVSDNNVTETDNIFLHNLTSYLTTDGRKLGDYKLVHALDILDHFNRSLLIPKTVEHPKNHQSQQRCAKVIRLYLGYLVEATDIYEMMVASFLNVPDPIKPKIISDMVSVAGYCKNLVLMLGQMGNEALDYIEPLLALIEKVVNTKELMKIPEDIDPSEIAIIDKVGPTYIEKFRPLLLQLLKQISENSIFIAEDVLSPLSDEWREIFSMYYFKDDLSFSDTIFRFVIRTESVRILKEIFNIDLNKEDIPHITINSNSPHFTLPDGTYDELTYDLLLAPVAIPTSNSVIEHNFVLVNQRTMHKILLDGNNPFTRQPMNYQDIIDTNSKPEVQEKIIKAFDFIRRITT